MSKDQKTLAVVGLGYVGLPVALLAAEKGWRVIGVDTDQDKVTKISNGISPIEDSEISKALKAYSIHATVEASEIADADMVVVAVPTPVTEKNEPDLGPLTSALESIKPHVTIDQIISIESTINPGVMDEVVVSTLSGAAAKENIVHCPERINPGDKKYSVRNIDRVIGGYSEEGVQRAKKYYESILDAHVMTLASVTEAEAVKIFENTFRDVNIAFVNEMARSFDKLGIDISHVIAGAATKPFAFMAHYPGSGVGGHCISVDPYYMIERARQVGFDHEFLKLARKINDSMPQYTVDLMDHGVESAGIESPKIALLGLSYKKNIDDTRESPALDILDILRKRGQEVAVFDPHVPGRSNVASLEEALQGANVVILAVDHDEFMDALTPETLKENGIQLIVDGKNKLNAEVIRNAGIAYYGIGRSNLAN